MSPDRRADVMTESARNVAYLAALQGVAKTAQELRRARADWAKGCPVSLAPKYDAQNAALDVLDALEKRP